MKTLLVQLAAIPFTLALQAPGSPKLLRRNGIRQEVGALSESVVNEKSSRLAQITFQTSKAFSTIAAAFCIAAAPALAVSGGGLDYAGLDISNQDFSGSNYKGKDFTQVIARGTKFAGSNLQGCRFYKAYLIAADFSGADLRGASLEDTSLDDASFRNTVASGAYFSSSILDVKDLENADFTDAQFPLKTIPLLCQRSDLKGVNPVTGADTRESVFCP
ncbi:hypothetical protein ACA910_002548 [Epithemia clementina (nom. ined.)]